MGENGIVRSWDFEGITSGFWDARSEESWRLYQEADADGMYVAPELRIAYRAGVGRDGTAITGLVILRTDGRAISARDLRRIRFPPPSRLWAKRLQETGAGKHAAPARPGPKGHPPEHWREVYGLWQQAMREAPHAPIKWIQGRYEPRMGEATIRRWVKRARRLHEEEQR